MLLIGRREAVSDAAAGFLTTLLEVPVADFAFEGANSLAAEVLREGLAAFLAREGCKTLGLIMSPPAAPLPAVELEPDVTEEDSKCVDTVLPLFVGPGAWS